jgi:hypothetical protein
MGLLRVANPGRHRPTGGVNSAQYGCRGQYCGNPWGRLHVPLPCNHPHGSSRVCGTSPPGHQHVPHAYKTITQRAACIRVSSPRTQADRANMRRNAGGARSAARIARLALLLDTFATARAQGAAGPHPLARPPYLLGMQRVRGDGYERDFPDFSGWQQATLQEGRDRLGAGRRHFQVAGQAGRGDLAGRRTGGPGRPDRGRCGPAPR